MPFPVKIIFFFLSRLADGFIFASEASEKYYCNLIQKTYLCNTFSSERKFLAINQIELSKTRQENHWHGSKR